MLISIGKSSQRQAPGLVELLLECHVRIRKFISLGKKIANATTRCSADQHDVEKHREDIVHACHDCVRYFVEALPLHVQDEEHSLLPLLVGHNSSLDAALAEMRRQHQSHEAKLQEFIAALRAVEQEPQSREWGHRLLLIASDLEIKFEEHLRLEEDHIFPQIPIVLSTQQIALVRDELRRRRNKGSSSEADTKI